MSHNEFDRERWCACYISRATLNRETIVKRTAVHRLEPRGQPSHKGRCKYSCAMSEIWPVGRSSRSCPIRVTRGKSIIVAGLPIRQLKSALSIKDRSRSGAAGSKAFHTAINPVT